MENKSHALAAGAFVLLVAALLAGLALWLTRDQTAYRYYELSSKDSVSGLQPQASVRYKGVAVGKVTRIGFDPQVSGNVLIRLAVDGSAPISDTTFATLGYQGVTGLAHIQLDDASRPLTPPPPGASGLPRLPLKSSPLSQLAEQGPAILGQIQEVTQRVNDVLSDDNQQRFATALEQMGNAAGSVDALARRLQQTVDTRLDPALASVPQVAADARQGVGLAQAGAQAARHQLVEHGDAVHVRHAHVQQHAVALRIGRADGIEEGLAAGMAARLQATRLRQPGEGVADDVFVVDDVQHVVSPSCRGVPVLCMQPGF